ncbi:unnamed protein product, partial [marine sediment metagenome]
ETDLQAIKESLEAFADFEEIKETVATLVEKEKETENLSSEILALVDYEDKVKELTESLSVLRRITQVVIPDSSPFEKAVNDVQWLREKEEKHRELAGIVEKLKGISKLRVPKITKMDSLVKEVDQLCIWDDTATKLIRGIKQQKEILDNFDMSEITATVEKAYSAFKEFHEAGFLEETFSDLAVETKATRDELREVTEKLKQKRKEKEEIKVCPLCERPL